MRTAARSGGSDGASRRGGAGWRTSAILLAGALVALLAPAMAGAAPAMGSGGAIAPPAIASATAPATAATSIGGLPAQATATSTDGATPSATAGQLALEQLSGMDTSAIAGFVDAIGRQVPGAGFSWQSLTALLHGGALFRHPGRLASALGAVFVGEVRASLALLGQLLVLVVFAAVVRQLQGAFEGEAVGRIADAMIFLALGAICLSGFALAVSLARGAIRDLSAFIVALAPAVIGLLAASGSPTTAGLLQPALLAAVNVVGIAVRTIVLPLALLAAVVDIAGAFSPSFRLSSLAGLMRQISMGVMGLGFTVFMGVVAVQGAAGSIADGVALRVGKYAVRAFIPVVGGMFADTAELVLTSGMLLRTGLGLVGLVTVALLMLVPVLKMLALWSIYRVAGAVAQPVGGEAVAQVLGGVGGALMVLTMAVATVGILCFLSLAVLVGAGGAAWAAR